MGTVGVGAGVRSSLCCEDGWSGVEWRNGNSIRNTNKMNIIGFFGDRVIENQLDALQKNNKK